MSWLETWSTTKSQITTLYGSYSSSLFKEELSHSNLLLKDSVNFLINPEFLHNHFQSSQILCGIFSWSWGIRSKSYPIVDFLYWKCDTTIHSSAPDTLFLSTSMLDQFNRTRGVYHFFSYATSESYNSYRFEFSLFPIPSFTRTIQVIKPFECSLTIFSKSGRSWPQTTNQVLHYVRYSGVNLYLMTSIFWFCWSSFQSPNNALIKFVEAPPQLPVFRKFQS